jgi:hypothetical protein
MVELSPRCVVEPDALHPIANSLHSSYNMHKPGCFPSASKAHVQIIPVHLVILSRTCSERSEEAAKDPLLY